MKVAQANGTTLDEVVLIGGTAKIGKVQLESSTGVEPSIGAPGDSDGPALPIWTTTKVNAWNGATYDRQRNNTQGTLLASAARTATVSSSDQTNYNGRGVKIYLNVTIAGTGSVTISIEEKDPVSGAYAAILTGVAVTTNGMTVYKIYPGFTAAANAVANDIVPRTWRVTVTHNNANSIAYSVGYANNL